MFASTNGIFVLGENFFFSAKLSFLQKHQFNEPTHPSDKQTDFPVQYKPSNSVNFILPVNILNASTLVLPGC